MADDRKRLYQQAPHLRHGDLSAFFVPSTLHTSLSALPNSLSSDNEVRAFLHEGVHFRQAVTTFYGIYDFLTQLRTLTSLGEMRTRAQGRDLTQDEVEELTQKHRTHRGFVGNLSSGWSYANADAENTLGQQAPFFGFASLPDHEHEHEKAPAYVKKDDDGIAHIFFITPRLLQESMAMSFEIIYDYGEDTLAFARSSFDPEVFQYAAGIECVQIVTGWTNLRALACACYCLCDFALNHPTPGVAFLSGAQVIAETTEENFELDRLDEIYAHLSERLEFEAVAQMRSEVYQNLNERISHLEKSQDEAFDSAFLAIMKTMQKAISHRANRPEYFADMAILHLADEEFIQDFVTPLIETKERVATYDVTSQRSDAVLFLSCAFHRLDSYVEQQQTDLRCPLHSMKHVCTFERTDDCKSAPWRRFKSAKVGDGTEVCTYRFVDHAFDSAPISGSRMNDT